MSLRTLITVGSVIGATSLTLACGAAVPPTELLDARSAYARAETSAARDVAPVELDKARLALNAAEASFRDEGNVRETRDLAYIAQRRSLAAIANGNVAAAQAATSRANEQAGHQRAELQRDTTQQLNTTRQQLASEQQQNATTGQQLADANQARTAAEQEAAAALESLRRVATVQEEARGMVITLSGSELFASGQSTLLPIAQKRLKDVAVMLVEQRGRNIVVEGHTDSRGSDSGNMALSKARAQAVVDFLVSKGVPSERIRAEGLGSARPIAENDAAEGRANNRRVEIVIQPGVTTASLR